MNMNRSKTFSRSLLSLAIAATLSSGSLLAPRAFAETPAPADAAAIARLDDLAKAMKSVNKVVEPSVVSIDVVKTATANANGSQEDMLKRFFPDNDGDGEPDVPPGMNFRFGPGGEGLKTRGEGSGVILDVKGDTAYVLTNNHVAGGADKIVVTLFDGRLIEDAEVVGTDPRTDLAVLKIKSDGLVGAKWADSESLDKGDIVLAFGAPFGYVGSMTQGIVSGVNRTTDRISGPFEQRDPNRYEAYIQTDCAINPGNSGGPLVNLRGEVVGINTLIASNTGSFSGLGFAIPSNMAKFVYESIRDDGKVTRGFLGVSISDVTVLPGRAKAVGYKDRTGAFVSEVRNDTPAEGKLQPNDIIVTVNEQPVATAQALRLKIATIEPGKEVKLGVFRDGKLEHVSLKLAAFPDDPQQASKLGQREKTSESDGIGASLTDATANRLKSFGLPGDAKGALVTAVKEGSPGQLAGLEVGDLITKIGDKPVTNAEEAVAALKGVKLSDGVNLMIRSKAGTKSVFIQIEE
jgi:serine protease Do